MQPNFLIIGAQKCGTTSLHDILSEHPEAGMSRIKEINFFNSNEKYQKGLANYSNYFKDVPQNKIVVGESSPGYICSKEAPQRIKDSLGMVKIVIILRDPIKRAYSQYWDNRRSLNEYYSERQIIEMFLETEYNPGRRGYFSRGVYHQYLNRYFNLFGRDNVHVMILEELIMNQTAELRKLYAFLGLNTSLGLQVLPKASNSSMVYKNRLYSFFFKNPSFVKFLPKRGKGLMFFGEKIPFKYELPENEVLDKLISFYKPHNEKLFSLLERRIENWL